MRARRIGWFAAVAVMMVATAACSAPRPAGTLADLDRWDSSTTYSENGQIVTATYDGWPMRDAPVAFVCTKTPEKVFDGSGVVLGADPACAGLTSHVDGDTLTVSLDRATLPQAFSALDTWITVLAMATDQGTWSISMTMPASFHP
jgi:hypothetical protein